MRTSYVAVLSVLVTWQAPAAVAVADPLINPTPAVPFSVPGGAPNNHAATPSQPSFGLLPRPGRGSQISAGLEAGHTARVSGGMTGGQLENPRGFGEGTAR